MPSVLTTPARYGLDFVDALTGAPAAGPFFVEADDPDARSFRATGSRWVFERLRPGVVELRVESPLYVPVTFETGSGGFPLVPDKGAPGVLAPVRLLPRTGYPFPPTLTRVVGLVLYTPTVAADPIPAVGANVQVSGVYRHSGAEPPVKEPALDTQTTDDGQYTMWFLPADVHGRDFERLPSQCDVAIEFTPPGASAPWTASLTAEEVHKNRTRGLPTVVLTPPPKY